MSSWGKWWLDSLTFECLLFKKIFQCMFHGPMGESYKEADYRKFVAMSFVHQWSDSFGVVSTSLHWKNLNWEQDDCDPALSLICIDEWIEMSSKVGLQFKAKALFPCLLYGSAGEDSEYGWTGRAFWPSGRNDGQHWVAQKGLFVLPSPSLCMQSTQKASIWAVG